MSEGVVDVCVSAHVIPGSLLLLVRFAGCNWVLGVTIITLSLGFNGAATVTNLANCQDLSPNFAGTVFGFYNFVGITTGFITPSVTSHITNQRVRWGFPLNFAVV